MIQQAHTHTAVKDILVEQSSTLCVRGANRSRPLDALHALQQAIKRNPTLRVVRGVLKVAHVWLISRASVNIPKNIMAKLV